MGHREGTSALACGRIVTTLRRMTRTKTVGYVRVSTASQRFDGCSIEEQTARMKAYAVVFDLELVAIIEDGGVSASSLERPGLQRALAMLDAGEAEALLVVKLDRLTRSVRDLGELVERYFAKRFRLMSVSDMVDTHSAAGRCVLNIITCVAQWEAETTAERTAEAMAHKKSKGEFCGGNSPRYGYTVVHGKLVPNEAEQLVISAILDFKAAGLSRREIATELDRAGMVSRTGKVFDATQIGRILKSDNAHTLNRIDKEFVRIVREYAACGLSDNDIAAELARVGITSRKGRAVGTKRLGQMQKDSNDSSGKNAPYGFSFENGLLVQNEAEQDVLRIVREMKEAGLSIRDIAVELNNAGIVAREHLAEHGIPVGDEVTGCDDDTAQGIVDDVGNEVDAARARLDTDAAHAQE